MQEAKMQDSKFSLTPIDHLMTRRHLFFLLYFPLSDPDIARIVSTFKSGLQRTFEALPILSGTVQPARQNEQSGSLCVGAPWNSIDDVFRVNDLTSYDLDYKDLRRNHFPITLSDQYDLFSILTSRSNPFQVENPVMMAQINFIRNGMILVPFLHHSLMDGLGGAAVMEIWATFCRGENGANMISDDMVNRERLMFSDETGLWEDIREYVNGSEAYDSGQRNRPIGSEASRRARGYSLTTCGFKSLATFFTQRLPGLLRPITSSRHTFSAPQLPKKVDVEIFFFSHSRLATLKSIVSASVARDFPGPGDSKAPAYISTNDALSALVFACVTEARRSTKSTDTQQVETIPFGLTVSGRRLLMPPMSKKYIGNFSIFCHLDLSLDSVTAEPHNLANIAHDIRKRLAQLDDAYVKKLIGALRTVDDISKVAPACRASKDWQFMISPWTEQSYYDMDWGRDVGRCERLRVPKVSSPAYDGTIVVLPKLKAENNGVGEEEEAGLEVAFGLEKSAMRRLKGMNEWTRWAQWRCS